MEEFEKAKEARNDNAEPKSKHDWSPKSNQDWGRKSSHDWGHKGRWNRWTRPSGDTPASSSWDTPTPAPQWNQDAGAGAGSIAGAGAGSINQPPKAGPPPPPWTTTPKMPPPPAIKAMPPVPSMPPAIPTQPESHQPPVSLIPANTHRSRRKEPHNKMICSICHQRCKTDFPCFLACGHGPWHPACIVQSLNVSWFV